MGHGAWRKNFEFRIADCEFKSSMLDLGYLLIGVWWFFFLLTPDSCLLDSLFFTAYCLPLTAYDKIGGVNVGKS